MEYIKYFENYDDYNHFYKKKLEDMGDENSIPNVSCIENNDDINIEFVSPIIENEIHGIINASNTYDYYKIIDGISNFKYLKSMYIDGEEVKPNSAFTFTTVGEHNFDIQFNGKINNMSGIFYRCSGLTSLDLSNWDTSNVTKMYMMFAGCSGLTSLDLSTWDTSNVTNMSYMFNGCRSLTSLDLSNWDTSNVTDMSGMFDECYKLTSLDSISNWDTSNVTDMFRMFFACSELTSLDLSNWDTSNVTNMGWMFYDCTGLTSLNLSGWDTSNVTDMDWMFFACTGLTSLDLSNWDTSNVIYMNHMFYACSNLTEIKMGGDVSNVTNVGIMFNGVASTGTFYYNSAYDYSNIIAELPSGWNAVPCTLVNGELIPIQQDE